MEIKSRFGFVKVFFHGFDDIAIYSTLLSCAQIIDRYAFQAPLQCAALRALFHFYGRPRYWRVELLEQRAIRQPAAIGRLSTLPPGPECVPGPAVSGHISPRFQSVASPTGVPVPPAITARFWTAALTVLFIGPAALSRMTPKIRDILDFLSSLCSPAVAGTATSVL